MYNNALNVYFSKYFPSRLKEDDISFSKKKYVHSEWGASCIEKRNWSGKRRKRRKSPFTRRGCFAEVYYLIYELLPLYKLRFVELVAARDGGGRHTSNVLLCKAKVTVQQSSGCWIRDRIREARQKYAWVHPLGFTMGATTLNLFTHLLGHAPPLRWFSIVGGTISL